MNHIHREMGHTTANIIHISAPSRNNSKFIFDKQYPVFCIGMMSWYENIITCIYVWAAVTVAIIQSLLLRLTNGSLRHMFNHLARGISIRWAGPLLRFPVDFLTFGKSFPRFFFVSEWAALSLFLGFLSNTAQFADSFFHCCFPLHHVSLCRPVHLPSNEPSFLSVSVWLCSFLLSTHFIWEAVTWHVKPSSDVQLWSHPCPQSFLTNSMVCRAVNRKCQTRGIVIDCTI